GGTPQLEVGARRPRSGFNGRLDVAGALGDTLRVPKQSHSLAGVARGRPGPGQIAKRAGLEVAIAGLPGNSQRLGVQVDGPPVLTQAVVAETQVIQPVALA